MSGEAGRRTVRMTVMAAWAVAGWVGLEYVLVRAVLGQWQLVTAPGPASLDEALALLAAGIAVLLCTWLGLSTLAVALTHVPGQLGRLCDRVACAWAPPVARRLAALLVGAAVTGALAPGTALGEAPPPAAAAAPVVPAPLVPASAVPASAAVAGTTLSRQPSVDPPGFTPTDSAVRVPGTPLPAPGFAPSFEQPTSHAQPTGAPGWVPTRPLQRRQPSAALVVPGKARPEPAVVVVHRGDSLWAIVARHLGPHASDAEVAQAWPRWYAANREVIGDDPDLVKPGQVLHAPGYRDTEAAR